MPPIATKDFRYALLDTDYQSSSEIKEIKPFSSHPSPRDQILLSHVTHSNSSSKSFGSKHSVFFPVKHSLPLQMNSIPQSVFVRSTIHSREHNVHLEQYPDQIITTTKPSGNELHTPKGDETKTAYNFKPVISVSEEKIYIKHDNEHIKSNSRLKIRQRPPFDNIEIYPEDEDMVSQLSFDGEYELETFHDDKDIKEVVFSRALMEQTDQIIRRAKELTSNVGEQSVNDDDAKSPQHQVESAKEHTEEDTAKGCNLKPLSRCRRFDQDIKDIVTEDCFELCEQDEKEDSQEQHNIEQEHASLLSSVDIDEAIERKSISPPLREIFIPINAVSCMNMPKETSKPRKQLNSQSKVIDDRISEIKKRGRLRYIEKNDHDGTRVKAACS